MSKFTWKDDRDEEQMSRLTNIVLGVDKFMSGWGEAEGTTSHAGWACSDEDLEYCREWVESRSDINRIRIVDGDFYPNPQSGHWHIYVWNTANRPKE